MDALPSEIIVHILSFLEPHEIAKSQLICRRFLEIARDGNLWRNECFENSKFLENLRRRKALLSSKELVPRPHFNDQQNTHSGGQHISHQALDVEQERRKTYRKAKERTRLVANWDPSYPSEKINWYAEFIQRSAPISISWLQQPQNHERKNKVSLEIRGLGTYTPLGTENATIAVAPVEDGSVCLWDLTGSSGKRGRITGQSSRILHPFGHNSLHLGKQFSGTIECISVNSSTSRAYIAVCHDLVEVDLETLRVVSHERFSSSISALSEAKGTIPITVGSSLGLHLYDSRARQLHSQDSLLSERLELPRGTSEHTSSVDGINPGALSILHLPNYSDSCDGLGEIYVAGRFPSILSYDRRYFPRLHGTIHSGARLCGLASMPFPLLEQESLSMRREELSSDKITAAKNKHGNTLIACGEYNTKGSLELYGLSLSTSTPSTKSPPHSGRLQYSAVKNRQTSSSSKLLSVGVHGTRIVFSDGGGNIKWVERDGYTEVRRWNISSESVDPPRGIFGTAGDFYLRSDYADIVRKILPTNASGLNVAPNANDLLLWTGEKIGLLGFSNKPGFTAEGFEETAQTLEEAHHQNEERLYDESMRRALETQADEVRFMRGLGSLA